MHILLVIDTIIPVTKYGGTERVVQGLAKELINLGHTVTFLAPKGSQHQEAKVIAHNPQKRLDQQIPSNVDLIHFHYPPPKDQIFKIPYIITMHGNYSPTDVLDANTIFVSQNHAERFGARAFVHNGLDWDLYESPELGQKRRHYHFLGKASWKIKNVKGAIDTVMQLDGERLTVMGGKRWHKRNGLLNCFNTNITYAGMVGGTEKFALLNASKGLVFPVRWHEPFGLAIVESLFYGCPVFGTPYGSLPELINEDTGFLATDSKTLAEGIKHGNYSKLTCHETAQALYSAKAMAQSYLKFYETVASGNKLHSMPLKAINEDLNHLLSWQ